MTSASLGVIVTGAGSGLGRALARAFAARGHRVFGLGPRRETLAETQQLAATGAFDYALADVSDPAQVERAFKEADAAIGQLDVLINNAAIYERFDFLERPSTTYSRTLEINLNGTIHSTHAALQRMTEVGAGRIINLTSFADLSPLPSSGAYSLSKGAVRLFTRALVADISDRFPDIVVTDWIPGALATHMGITDGLAPDLAAEWGVALALDRSPDLNGALFDRDTEVLPGRSLKGRIRDFVLLQPTRKPKRLTISAPVRNPL